MSKLVSLKEAVELVNSNDSIAFGGNVLHRTPHRFIYELALSDKKNLEVIKTAGAHDVDVLSATGKVKSVIGGFISYETEYGLCSFYRKGVESGEVKAKEHACYTVISGLRASIQGVPFMPLRGMVGSQLLNEDYFELIESPFEKEELVAVKAIIPNVAVIHVQEADVDGNSRIYGPQYEDVLFAKASGKVIITTEKIIKKEEVQENGYLTNVPGFLVDAVVELPNGANPGTCAGLYDLDHKMLSEFKKLKSKDEVTEYLNNVK